MRKARLITVSVLVLATFASLGFVAQPSRSRRQGSPIIHRKMEAMAEAWDALTESLGAGETAAALKSLQKMQEAVIDAKARTPAITKEFEAEEREAQNADFRKRLVGVLRLYCDLEVLIIDGDTEGAMDLLAGEIHTAEREGHNIFRPKRGG